MKRKLLITLLSLVCILCLSLGLAACSNDDHGSLQTKVQKLEIGYTTEQVKNVLGTPDEEESDNWKYYGGEFKTLVKRGKELEDKLLSVDSESELEDILNQLVELEEKMSAAEYPYVRVGFDDKNKLKSVIFDAKVYGGEIKYNKTIKTYELFPKVVTLFSNPNSTKLNVKEIYTDGSFYMGAGTVNVSEINTCSKGVKYLSWSSYFSDKTVKDCSSSVTVSENIIAGTEISGTLGAHTFSYTVDKNCTVDDLELDIVLSGNDTALTYNAESDTFWNNICSYITGVQIPNSITSIGDKVFYNCSRLASIEIPEGVTSIGTYAFRDCTGLTDVALPDSLEEINQFAFWGCTRLTSITIPKNVKTVYGLVFSGCSSLKTVYWNAVSCERCGSGAWGHILVFDDCSITALIVGDGVVSLPRYGFARCKELTSITIPISVTNIEAEAFYDCPSLTEINYEGTKAQWNAIEREGGWDYEAGD